MPTSPARPASRDRLRLALIWAFVLVATALVLSELSDYTIVVRAEDSGSAVEG